MEDPIHGIMQAFHSADLMQTYVVFSAAGRRFSRYHHVSEDGRTNFQGWKGGKFNKRVVGPAECVMYLKTASKGQDKLGGSWMGQVRALLSAMQRLALEEQYMCFCDRLWLGVHLSNGV